MELNPIEALRTGAAKINADRETSKVEQVDVKKLKELIRKLHSLMASMPAEVQSLIAGLISEAEGAIQSGDTISIGRLIGKLEEALAMIQEVLELIAKGLVDQANAIIAAFVTNLTGQKKAKDKMILQQEISLEASLESLLNLKFGKA